MMKLINILIYLIRTETIKVIKMNNTYMSHQSVVEFMKTFIESLGFKDVEWIESEYKEGRYSKCYLPARMM